MIVFTIFDRIWGKGTMLRLSGFRVSVTCQLLVKVFRHGEVDKTLVIVPLEVDTAIEVASVVFNDLVGL